jgi:hypothetical protein
MWTHCCRLEPNRRAHHYAYVFAVNGLNRESWGRRIWNNVCGGAVVTEAPPTSISSVKTGLTSSAITFVSLRRLWERHKSHRTYGESARGQQLIYPLNEFKHSWNGLHGNQFSCILLYCSKIDINIGQTVIGRFVFVSFLLVVCMDTFFLNRKQLLKIRFT